MALSGLALWPLPVPSTSARRRLSIMRILLLTCQDFSRYSRPRCPYGSTRRLPKSCSPRTTRRPSTVVLSRKTGGDTASLPLGLRRAQRLVRRTEFCGDAGGAGRRRRPGCRRRAHVHARPPRRGHRLHPRSRRQGLAYGGQAGPCGAGRCPAGVVQKSVDFNTASYRSRATRTMHA